MAAKLEAYNQKRNFERTLEPKGSDAETSQQLRFVVQHHMARRDHYDLRLEWKGVLLSWAVPKGPSHDTQNKRLAVQVEDHPVEYCNFEGTIPKGEYGGGTVMLWDEGFWEPLGDVSGGLEQGSLKFTLKGRRLKGKWALVRMKAKTGETRANWLLLKERDQYAQAGDEISRFTTSIRTGRTMAEIEAGEPDKIIRNPFFQEDIQLASLVSRVPSGEEWLYELKYDGYRILGYVEGNSVRLMTRGGNDYTNRFGEVAASLVDWAAGRAMVVDGEMVVVDGQGRTDFQALQNHMRNPTANRLLYLIFDLLALDGQDLREKPLIQRKETLEALMQDAPPHLHYSRHIRGAGEECFLAACRMNLEGIVGKKADSIYSGGRNGNWIKLKCAKRQEFVIGGYTKKNRGISSLLLGVYQNGELVYAGRAGTGLSERDIGELGAKFASMEKGQSPFQPAPKARANEAVVWLEPELVAEIQFAGWTQEHLLRQASFKGLRLDKDPAEIKRELAEDEIQPEPSAEQEKPMQAKGSSLLVEGIRITNPDKVLFEDPVITKGDVARYYAQISQRMLPYVSRRVLSVVRCPKGVSQACFFKKHPSGESKGIVPISIPNSDGEREHYFYMEDVSGLISEAQMGALEFHIWGSRVDTLEQPDIMVFDLDPDEGMALDVVRQGVRDLKSILTELSLQSFLKTSGGKGYHVVVPLKPGADWSAFRDFAQRIAQVMEQKWPDRYTSNVRKAQRKNKIFIDWIRNGRGATSVAPYSIRARAGGAISMPIGWDELDTVAPDGIRMTEALKRISDADPWENFFQYLQMLQGSSPTSYSPMVSAK